MRLIKLKEVMTLTSLARSTIYKYMSEGQFPKAVLLDVRSVAWIEDEVTDWILERINDRDRTGKNT